MRSKMESGNKRLTAIDNYLLLSRGDRKAIYRRLSVSDRLQLDRKIRQQTSKTPSRPKHNKSLTANQDTPFADCSPWLSAQIETILLSGETKFGNKTVSYLRSYPSKKSTANV